MILLAAALLAFQAETARGVEVLETREDKLDSGYANRHALVIGIDEYKDANFPRLKHAAADANAVADVLTQKYGFPVSNIKRLINTDATRDAIQSALDDWACDPDRTSEDDLFVIYFAGHGITRFMPNGNRGYLVPYDGQQSKFSTLVSMSVVDAASEALLPKHALFLLDCCFSGLTLMRSAPPVAPGLGARAREILTAGSGEQSVLDSGGKGHSVFTQSILDALDGRADSNKDGVVTFGELSYHVSSEVERKTERRQTPLRGNLRGHDGGSCAFFAPDLAANREASLRPGLVIDGIDAEGTVLYTQSPTVRLNGALTNSNGKQVGLLLRGETTIYDLAEDGRFEATLSIEPDSVEPVGVVLPRDGRIIRHLSIVHDSTPPAITELDLVPSITTEAEHQLRLSISDTNPFTVELLSGTGSDLSLIRSGEGDEFQFAVKFSRGGTRYFAVNTIDAAGNKSGFSQILTYDHLGPTLRRIEIKGKKFSQLGEEVSGPLSERGLLHLEFWEHVDVLEFDGVQFRWPGRPASRFPNLAERHVRITSRGNWEERELDQLVHESTKRRREDADRDHLKFTVPFMIPEDAGLTYTVNGSARDSMGNVAPFSIESLVLPPTQSDPGTLLRSFDFPGGLGADISPDPHGFLFGTVLSSLRESSSPVVTFRAPGTQLVFIEFTVNDRPFACILQNDPDPKVPATLSIRYEDESARPLAISIFESILEQGPIIWTWICSDCDSPHESTVSDCPVCRSGSRPSRW